LLSFTSLHNFSKQLSAPLNERYELRIITLRTLIFIVLIITSVSSHAATAVCTGTVSRLAFHVPDGLYLAIGSTKIFKVCSPQVEFYRTSPESCKLIASIATIARATGKQLQIHIDNAPTTSCSDITDWFEADIRFVELKQ